MANLKRYPIAKSMLLITTFLELDAERIARRAGLSPDFLRNDIKGMTALEYFALWDAVFDEVGDPSLALEAVRRFAGSPFIPAMLAFSSSPNTEIGLTRLALFKPLVGPIKLEVKRVRSTVEIAIGSTDEDAPIPASTSALELVYFVESARRCTGHHIVPLAIAMPQGVKLTDDFAAYFGVMPMPSDVARITLSLADAERPLISENGEFWRWLEIDLKRQMAERNATMTVAERVRAVLIDMLPAGDASADAVSKRLGMSKRSLQRKLSDEGDPYQSVLDATRSELAIRYLSKGDMSVEEISYLLAYQDPNSFYRAFQGWTGMTPAEARGRAVQ
ncbi:MAG: AraC family transcriptional regulator ligand-binding domain-containing protein [Pseudomonadota bacterium]